MIFYLNGIVMLAKSYILIDVAMDYSYCYHTKVFGWLESCSQENYSIFPLGSCMTKINAVLCLEAIHSDLVPQLRQQIQSCLFRQWPRRIPFPLPKVQHHA